MCSFEPDFVFYRNTLPMAFKKSDNQTWAIKSNILSNSFMYFRLLSYVDLRFSCYTDNYTHVLELLHIYKSLCILFHVLLMIYDSLMRKYSWILPKQEKSHIVLDTVNNLLYKLDFHWSGIRELFCFTYVYLSLILLDYIKLDVYSRPYNKFPSFHHHYYFS